jgi:transposase InsO family protein
MVEQILSGRLLRHEEVHIFAVAIQHRLATRPDDHVHLLDRVGYRAVHAAVSVHRRAKPDHRAVRGRQRVRAVSLRLPIAGAFAGMVAGDTVAPDLLTKGIRPGHHLAMEGSCLLCLAEARQTHQNDHHNGPELTSRHFLAWCVERQIELIHIQPGKPTQNARVESFHGRLREECLQVSWFQNLFDAKRKIAVWQKDYNEDRPHSSLGYRTPKEFAAAQAAGFYTAERGARDSNAVPGPSRSPIPAHTGEGTNGFCRMLK